jgi:hypothetical protein
MMPADHNMSGTTISVPSHGPSATVLRAAHLALGQPSAAASLSAACPQMIRQDFTDVPGAPTAITSAQPAAAHGSPPAYCEVRGYIEHGGQIEFAVRLPLVRPEAAVAGVVTAPTRLIDALQGLDDAGLRRRGPTRFGFETSGWDLLVAEATLERDHARLVARIRQPLLAPGCAQSPAKSPAAHKRIR